jgi:hypothetical protein
LILEISEFCCSTADVVMVRLWTGVFKWWHLTTTLFNFSARVPAAGWNRHQLCQDLTGRAYVVERPKTSMDHVFLMRTVANEIVLRVKFQSAAHLPAGGEHFDEGIQIKLCSSPAGKTPL